MDNPFREKLDTKRETFPAKIRFAVQPARTNFVVQIDDKKQITDLDYEYIYYNFRGAYPQFCDEHEISDEMLKKLYDKQFGEEK